MQYKRPLCASASNSPPFKTKQNTTTAATFSGKDNAFFYSLKICTKKNSFATCNTKIPRCIYTVTLKTFIGQFHTERNEVKPKNPQSIMLCIKSAPDKVV